MEEYKEMKKRMPKSIDWQSIKEVVDVTTASQELACVGDHCEI